MNYLNESFPVKVSGTDESLQIVGGYELNVSCENQMLSPIDPIWDKIKKEFQVSANFAKT